MDRNDYSLREPKAQLERKSAKPGMRVVMFVPVAWNTDRVWVSGNDFFRKHFSPEEFVNVVLHTH